MTDDKAAITLNYTTYPLVVGSANKYTFDDWETSGSSIQLTAGVCHSRYTEQDVVWESGDPAIAPVEKGLVRGRTTGFTEITASLPSGERAVCVITVIDNLTRATILSLELNARKLRLEAGSKVLLRPIVLPFDVLGNGAMNRSVRWESSDESVAAVDGKGNVTALREGNAVIRAISADVGRTGSCAVQVAAGPILTTGITGGDSPETPLGWGEKIKLRAATAGADCTLEWKSNNPYIADVDETGEVTAYSPGSAEIYATTNEGGFTAVFPITVGSTPFDISANATCSETPPFLVRPIDKENGNSVLRNLHIPEETVTLESALLLWNRASLLDTGDFDSYTVFCGGEQKCVTRKLGWTAKDLRPDTGYVFTVNAVDGQGTVLASETVSVRTKSAPMVIDVTGQPFNAVGNGRTMDTFAIQSAINTCPKGGTVLLPKGRIFHSGALFLKSDMTFRVDGILIGSIDPKDYPRVVTRWEGWKKTEQSAEEWANTTDYNPVNHRAHASLLNAGVYDEGEWGKYGPCNVQNIVICGSGMVNGNGFRLAYNEGPNRYDLNGGLPVPKSPIRDQTLRSRLLTLHNARCVYVTDIQFAYGASWQLHPIFCDRVTFDHVSVISKGNGKTGAADDITILNGDGIDPESSTNVNIFDCYFRTGDDAVSLKSGRNREGNELAKPNAYIRITDCVSEESKGAFCIGSEQAAGTHDVLWQNLSVRNVWLFGLWIKSMAQRGGVTERIFWRDCAVNNVQGGIFLDLARRHGTPINPAATLPKLRHTVFENISIAGCNDFGIRANGLAKSRVRHVTFRGIRIRDVSEKPFEFTCCEDVVLKDITVERSGNGI
jgi:polygalacturonase/uncharacterized protein YjdB